MPVHTPDLISSHLICYGRHQGWTDHVTTESVKNCQRHAQEPGSAAPPRRSGDRQRAARQTHTLIAGACPTHSKHAVQHSSAAISSYHTARVLVNTNKPLVAAACGLVSAPSPMHASMHLVHTPHHPSESMLLLLQCYYAERHQHDDCYVTSCDGGSGDGSGDEHDGKCAGQLAASLCDGHAHTVL